MLIKCKDKQESMNITKFSLWMIAGIRWRDLIVAYDIIHCKKLNIVTMF